MQRPDLLYVAARDIESASFQFETAQQPTYVWSSMGRKAKEIHLPFLARRMAPTSRAVRPRRRQGRAPRGHDKLFKDL